MNNTEQSIIEVVAKAICGSLYDERPQSEKLIGRGKFITLYWRNWKPQAKAALLAVRDTQLDTDSVILAADCMWKELDKHDSDGSSNHHYSHEAEVAIRAYINTLLGEVK